MQSWHQDDPRQPQTFAQEDKARVREGLVACMGMCVEQPIVAALGLTLRVAFRHDFPDRWPDLPAQLVGALRSEHPVRVCNAMQAVCVCAHVYMLRAADALAPMDMFINAVYPHVLQICQVIAAAFNTPEAGAALRWASKAYAYAMFQHIEYHPYLYSRDSFIAWCGLFNTLMGKPLPEPGAPGEPSGQPVSADARESWVWWRVRKWATKVFHRLAEVYGQPSKESKPHMKELTHLFNKHVAPQVTATLISAFTAWRTHGGFLSRRFQLYGLHVLQSCVDFASSWAVIKPHVPFLVRDVCFHIFKLTPQEIELFTVEPTEYMRLAVDPKEQFVSPRQSATLFIHALVANRPKYSVPVIDAVVLDVVTAYASAAPEHRDAVSKEAILFLVQDLSMFYIGEKSHRGQVEPLLRHHVTPDFDSPVPWVRARVAAVWTSFCWFGFSDLALPQHAFQRILGLMQDPSPVVRLTAGGCISTWIEKATPIVAPIVEPMAVPIIEQLFRLLNDMGLDEVVTSITAVLENFPDVVPHVAPAVIQRLIAVFQTLLAETEDDGVTLEDEVGLASEGMLETIKAILDVLHEKNRLDVFEAVLPYVVPLISSLLAKEGPALEFTTTAFDMLGDIIVAMEGRTALMNEPWLLYIKMLDTYRSCGLDYTEQMSYPVSALMTYCPERFAVPDPATGADYLQALIGTMEYCIAHADEHEMGLMGRLALEVLHNLAGKADRGVAAVVTLYGRLVSAARTKYLRSIACTVVGYALMYNAGYVLQVLEQQGMTLQFFVDGLAAVSGRFFKKSPDCKMTVLGFANVLKLPVDTLPPAVREVLPQLLSAIVSLQLQYEALLVKEAEKRKKFEEEERELAEDDDDDDDEFFTGEGVDDAEDHVGGEDDAVKRSAEEELAGRDDDDVDSDVPPEQTPLDHIEHVLHIQEAVLTLASQPAAAAIQAALPADVQTALQLLLARAQQLRALGRAPGAFGVAPDTTQHAATS